VVVVNKKTSKKRKTLRENSGKQQKGMGKVGTSVLGRAGVRRGRTCNQKTSFLYAKENRRSTQNKKTEISQERATRWVKESQTFRTAEDGRKNPAASLGVWVGTST